MEIELIKNKVYCKIFDRNFTVSSGKYNIQKAKNTKNLAEIQHNINVVTKEFNADDLIILNQIHGNKIIDIEKIKNPKYKEGDGTVTIRKRIALGILTADCVPVLMASDNGSVIGAAHCGWKSAKSGIIDNLYKCMKSKGAKKIKALIGPSIQQKSYEVDLNYFQNFIQDDVNCEQFFIASHRNSYYMFDLPAYVSAKIQQNDIDIVANINEDTYELENKYPSCRRSYHKNETYSQHILSTIIIR